MIIKKKKGHRRSDSGLSVVFHGYTKGEVGRFTRAFHSNCKHVGNKRIGCAGVSYAEGVTKYGLVQVKV